jgi:LEA14-like dessication related protein
MPILHEPAIRLEGVKFCSLSLSSLCLDVAIRVQNQNPIGITLREIPFIVLFNAGDHQQEIANGNTGNIRIPARDSITVRVPVTSHNKALIRALAAFVAKGGIEITIKGVAIIDCLVTGWSVPFEKTVTLTATGLACALAGRKSEGK